MLFKYHSWLVQNLYRLTNNADMFLYQQIRYKIRKTRYIQMNICAKGRGRGCLNTLVHKNRRSSLTMCSPAMSVSEALVHHLEVNNTKLPARKRKIAGRGTELAAIEGGKWGQIQN